MDTTKYNNFTTIIGKEKEGETKEGVCIEKNQEDGINTKISY